MHTNLTLENGNTTTEYEPAPTAELGTTITIQFDDDRPETFVLLDATAVLHPTSPVGKAILGATAGESFTVMLPAGKLTRVRLLEIQ